MKRDILMDIVKKSIEKEFNSDINIDKSELIKNNNFLNEKRATFITLTLNNELRGCIGSLEADKTLFDDLVNNSYMAAFQDPRFLELSLEEFKKVEIEISILTPPTIVEYKDFEDLRSKIKPNIDGVIIEQEGKRSTFLPQVWKMLPTFDEFFAHLCYKGGFEVDDSFNPKVYKYEVEKIK
ncbi:AMMECR1 domain-containing protein [Aliarcobacter trophiarum LMG 25534]|uniref:AMMECR1 domain-containing protein n=1 Tax=Aliarcobacter trophiarum LMG 25534 TaxID=1032241 RepID=A0AAD0QKD0_9BACT|nr:AmmeMemoRadiSam system protein A [Aliarcobacter trophiarum]AXK48515.1 AmmeMemoRadiSam system protein A [Aliarcobacter trophiarum LMG 25534]RXI27682.1 AMMECR1 domain-containing protein [Aliarcobacter trophiarum]RXJ89362.1 AMMECR1 domain-containing protein [Aliarcobacter trophiarum LMG 25534]